MSTAHPPWLRFQAYTVGLPKTGSTSLAAMFSGFRAGHEAGMALVAPAALERSAGEITDEEFWQRTGTRLSQPHFEMDSATFHHLYADLLAARYPQAVFLHSIRDARSWVNSMLDMTFRKAVARRQLGETWEPWERRTVELMLGGVPLLDMYDNGSDDSDAVAPLLAFWAEHMRRMSDLIPPERLLRLRVNDLDPRSTELAQFVGVDVRDLQLSRTHSNRSPMSFDRFTDPALNGVHADLCAALEKEFDCEAVAMTSGAPPRTKSWQEYAHEVSDWAREAIATQGRGVAR